MNIIVLVVPENNLSSGNKYKKCCGGII